MLKQQGQTMIEALLAIFIIMMALLGFLSRSSQNYMAGTDSMRRIIAINLAREGVELVKNIRDSNWLVGCNDPDDEDNCLHWYSGLYDGTGNNTFINFSFNRENNQWTNLFHDDELTFIQCIENESCRLYLDEGAYTSEVTDAPTEFYRWVETIGFCNDELGEVDEYECPPDSQTAIGLIVRSAVRYKFKNTWHNVGLEEWLYDWR